MTKKDFTKAGALPEEPTSEEVFSSLIGEAKPKEPKAEPKAKAARRYGREPGASGHKSFCLWLSPKSMEGAKTLAKIKDEKLSVIVDEALRDYLAKPENARLIRKYKKAFDDAGDED